MIRLFISYAHEDVAALERLHTHLAVLRREGKITSWHDRDIRAGDDFSDEIQEALAAADIFLALVSPDFLASDYCYEKEMAEALKRHADGTIRVIPVIVEPCEWTKTPLQRLKAVPRDGKPISEWANANTAYLDIASEIRRVTEAEAAPGAPETIPVPARASTAPAPRRYRVKRDFDEIDRADFRQAAFQTIKQYLVAAVAEIDEVDGIRARFAELGPNGFTCTVINRARDRGAAHLTVHVRGGREAVGDISFTHQENGPPNTASGWFNIEADEYELFLKGSMGFRLNEKRMAPKLAAEQLWDDLLERAGIVHV